MYGPRPIIVLSQNVKREQGRKVQLSNITAAKAIADVIRTCLGPRAMLKMLMDPMGGIVMTNDGNAVLREITVQHPAAKSMIEISRTQDEEVGDGTTSVIILAGEMLGVAEPFIEQGVHPSVIITAYRQALDDLLTYMRDQISQPVNINDREAMLRVISSCLNTKFVHQWGRLACEMALQAVQTVCVESNGRREIDIKRYAKVEKIPGGSIDESVVLKGLMINKDVVHAKMRRRIEKPRIVLLDCALEYKKGESQTNVEVTGEHDFARLLQLEEEYIAQICADILRVKPDLVITEKGISDLAQHYLIKGGASAIRRVRKTDNLRIERACGATIVNRTEELKEEDVGTRAGLFEVKMFGDEYFTFITECDEPKACTILLRGASKDILNEVDRNLNDAMNVARNVMIDPRLVPGGGACEMAISTFLQTQARSVAGLHQGPYLAASRAIEVIPGTLAQNCGGNVIRTLTALRAKHAAGEHRWGVNGETGQIVDMNELGIWEPMAVKAQTYKTAIETAILLLRIDDIVSGSKRSSGQAKPQAQAAPTDESKAQADD